MTASWSFDAIGTRWSIDTRDPLPDPLRASVAGLIEDYDRAFSRFRPDSLVRRQASAGGTVDYPAAAAPLFALYERMERVTDGRVTPLVGACLERLGYDAEYRLVPAGAPVPAPRAGLTVAGTAVTLREPALLDVGAAGKGQLVDLVAELLAEQGAADVVVDAGGDLRCHGGPQLVALEHPDDPSLAVGVAEVGGVRCAIAGSAVNRRVWGDGWHHVLDAIDGRPVRGVAATWALAADTMNADLLATALFFVAGERLERDFDFDWVRLLADGRIEHSASLPGEVFA